MHTVSLRRASCRATTSSDLHGQERALVIAVAAQFDEAKGSAPSGGGLSIVLVDFRADCVGKPVGVSTNLIWAKPSGE